MSWSRWKARRLGVKEAQQQVNDSQRALDRAQADQAANQRLLDDYQRAVERYESDLAALEDDSEQAHLTLESAQEALDEAEQAWSSAPDVADDAGHLKRPGMMLGMRSRIIKFLCVR